MSLECHLCHFSFDELLIADHQKICIENYLKNKPNTYKTPKYSPCELCKKDIDVDELKNHFTLCYEEHIKKQIDIEINDKHKCYICAKMFDKEIFKHHINKCSQKYEMEHYTCKSCKKSIKYGDDHTCRIDKTEKKNNMNRNIQEQYFELKCAHCRSITTHETKHICNLKNKTKCDLCGNHFQDLETHFTKCFEEYSLTEKIDSEKKKGIPDYLKILQ